MRLLNRISIASLALALVACGVGGGPTGAANATTPPLVESTTPPSPAGATSPPTAAPAPSTVVPTAITGPGAVESGTAGPTAPPLSSPAEITLADDGRTVQMAVGESFALKLGDDYTWDITIADSQVVSRKVNVTMVRGAQGIYEAHMAGHTELTATGTPNCAPGVACPAIARLFHLTIGVG